MEDTEKAAVKVEVPAGLAEMATAMVGKKEAVKRGGEVFYLETTKLVSTSTPKKQIAQSAQKNCKEKQRKSLKHISTFVCKEMEWKRKL